MGNALNSSLGRLMPSSEHFPSEDESICLAIHASVLLRREEIALTLCPLYNRVEAARRVPLHITANQTGIGCESNIIQFDRCITSLAHLLAKAVDKVGKFEGDVKVVLDREVKACTESVVCIHLRTPAQSRAQAPIPVRQVRDLGDVEVIGDWEPCLIDLKETSGMNTVAKEMLAYRSPEDTERVVQGTVGWALRR